MPKKLVVLLGPVPCIMIQVSTLLGEREFCICCGGTLGSWQLKAQSV
jgi:hypothetical protein